MHCLQSILTILKTPAVPIRQFPGNRENSRELLKFQAISALSAAYWRPFALQFQCAADDSLLCTEQRIFVAGSGNVWSEQGISYPQVGGLRRGLMRGASVA